MKKLPFLSLLFIILGCNHKPQDQIDNPSTTNTELPTVFAAFETEPVSANPDDDAADDPAFWYNAEQPMLSLIIGSDKKLGIDLYNLQGKRLMTYEVGRINNVDIRQNVLGGIDLVGGTHRTKVSMDFWTVNKSDMTLQAAGSIATDLQDVYGFCLYEDPNTKECFAFVNSKTGAIDQWKLEYESGTIVGTKVRTLQLAGQVEGMVADDAHRTLYVGLEDGGVFRFKAGATDPVEAQFIAGSDSSNTEIVYDIEGLTIYATGSASGYLIASSQGNNTYAVFDREGMNEYIGSFGIVDSLVDAVQETDGIHATNFALGDAFPNGIFICQDGFNFDDDKHLAQNFKVVDWRLIAARIEAMGGKK